MAVADKNVKIFGTMEEPLELPITTVGPLSFLITTEGIRRICYEGVEVIRAITWPVRDESWGTYAADVLEEVPGRDGDGFTYRLRWSVGAGRLHCEMEFRADVSGAISARITMTPKGGAFATNRAGFTVLHPIEGVAGTPLTVRHGGGAEEATVFPKLISPGQPVMDIAGLAHEVGGCSVDIAFGGEIFEMEDQRNWSDASYKTYCVPLVFPFTYEIDAPVTQTIEIALSGAGRVEDAGQGALRLAPSGRGAPEIGLVVEDGWLGSAEGVAASGVGHLVLRFGAENESAALGAVAELGVEVDAEIVLRDAADVRAALGAAADRLSEAGIAPRRVLALREGYLASHQPSGPWPEGPSPDDVSRVAREVFGAAEIGGGMMTNFTETNRCRPDPALFDYLTHANSGIVHAGDDLSIMETLETLPQIFASAEAISGGKAYRLGLVSIGMRTNPYGAAVAENPQQIRRTMAHVDPRHRGLFGAAWAVGVLGATQGSAVEALCLGAPSGPFGIAYVRQDWPQVGYDGVEGAQVYPLFHVVKAAAAMAGKDRLEISGLPEGLVAYGAGESVMIADVSGRAGAVDFGSRVEVAYLDTGSFEQAIGAPDWLEICEKEHCDTVDLEPFGVAFVKIGG